MPPKEKLPVKSSYDDKTDKGGLLLKNPPSTLVFNVNALPESSMVPQRVEIEALLVLCYHLQNLNLNLV